MALPGALRVSVEQVLLGLWGQCQQLLVPPHLSLSCAPPGYPRMPLLVQLPHLPLSVRPDVGRNGFNYSLAASGV